MNISETAFVLPMEKTDQNPFKNGAKFELRWFTPTTEVPLCGHATLASAATLFYTQFNENVSKNYSYLVEVPSSMVIVSFLVRSKIIHYCQQIYELKWQIAKSFKIKKCSLCRVSQLSSLTVPGLTQIKLSKYFFILICDLIS